MAGAIQAQNSATSGLNQANQAGAGLPTWAVVALAAVALIVFMRVAR